RASVVPQLRDVSEISRSGSGFLVLEQVVLRDEENGNGVHGCRHTARPGIIELYTGDGGQDVDPIWRASKLDDLLRPEKGVGADAEVAEAKSIKDAADGFCVGLRHPDEEVEVARKPR